MYTSLKTISNDIYIYTLDIIQRRATKMISGGQIKHRLKMLDSR